MYSTPVDLSFFYLRSAVEASLDRKKGSDGTKQDHYWGRYDYSA